MKKVKIFLVKAGKDLKITFGTKNKIKNFKKVARFILKKIKSLVFIILSVVLSM